MVIHRRAAGPPAGWRLSAVFNSLLAALPILAGLTLAAMTETQGWRAEPTPTAVVETQTRLRRAFSALPPRGADRRLYWTDLVERELGQRDLAAATGFLLAAPDLLAPDTGRTIRAAADEDPVGSANERLARAALLYLPNDIRKRYEALHRPVFARTSALPERRTDDLSPDTPTETTPLRRFNIIGSPADLVGTARNWANGGDEDLLILRLKALAFLAEDMDGPSGQMFATNAPEAVSIIKAAQRAGRIDPDFAIALSLSVENVMPEDALREALTRHLTDLLIGDEAATAMIVAFNDAFQQDGLAALAREMRHVARISQETSASGAVALLEQVQSSEDLQRVRLLAEAGGDRSVALVKQIGSDALNAADTGVKLSFNAALYAMAFAAVFMAAIWTTLLSLRSAFTSR